MKNQTIDSISELIRNTKAQINNETIDMKIGVPQGAVLSPTLFNIYINDLIVDLEKIGLVFAFADDIVCGCYGQQELDQTINCLENWTKTNLIDINYSKSGIMAIRKDKRTPSLRTNAYRNFPIVNSYKYLGVMIDDSLKFDIELQYKK